MRELLLFLDFTHVLIEVTYALLPLVLVFIVFQIFFLKLPVARLRSLAAGMLLSFLGLILFLQGVNIGFLPAGQALGESLGNITHNWMVIPLGFVMGFVATIAEPAVRILSYEIEQTSTGRIRQRTMIYVLSFGVAIFTALGMAKIYFGIPIVYIILPGYLIALVAMRFTDQEFVGIAFDSGGVATGPMTVTFVMAIALGFASALEGRDPVIDGFGLIALVAMAPILSVIFFGIVYSRTRESQDGTSTRL